MFVNLGGDESSKPTYFEVVAADRLVPSLKAAVIYALSVFSQRQPWVHRLLNYDDEVFALLTLALDGHSLFSTDSTFSDSLYGLKRKPLRPGASDRLSRRQRWLMLACQVLLPYLRAKTEKVYRHYAATSPGSGVLGLALRYSAAQGSVAEADDGGNSGVGQEDGSWSRRLQRAFVASYPWIHAGIEGTTFAYHLAYLLGASPAHQPVLHALGVTMARTSAKDLALEWWYTAAEDTLAKGKRTTNPATLATSGYVFCYPCAFAHVLAHGRCPVSGLGAGLDHVRKLYEAARARTRTQEQQAGVCRSPGPPPVRQQLQPQADASLLSSSSEYEGGRASQQRLPGASGSGSAALFEANTHLLLHGEVLLGAALFVPPRATQQHTAHSATIAKAGAAQSAAEGGPLVPGGEAAPLPPTPNPAEASSAQLAASLAPQPADQAWEAIPPAAMAAALRSAAAEAAAGASQPLTARLPYTFLLPLAPGGLEVRLTLDAAAPHLAAAQCVAAACHHWAHLHAGEHLDGQQSAAGGGGYAATARRGPGHSCPPLHLAAITGSSGSSGSSGRPDTSALDPLSQCPALIIMSPQDVIGGRGAAVSSGGSGSSGSMGSDGKGRLLPPRQGHRQGQRSGASAARDAAVAATVAAASGRGRSNARAAVEAQDLLGPGADVPAGRSATGSWGRDEQGRLRRFSARTTRILNSILASSGSAGTAGAAANGHDGGSADTE
eukprot:XP_001696296.1 predicted protein [Chlamydomonas reinhardtii]